MQSITHRLSDDVGNASGLRVSSVSLDNGACSLQAVVIAGFTRAFIPFTSLVTEFRHSHV